MGDSEGEQVTFEESAPDIAAALNAFMEAAPNLEGVVLWGLCDAASAILMFCIADPRVRGVVLLNPWVRNDATLASARISNYYGNRFISALFWKRLLSGKVNIRAALRGFLTDWQKKLRRRPMAKSRKPVLSTADSESEYSDFREQMLTGFQHCRIPVLLILSGADLTAGEFVELCQADQRWADALSRKNVTVQRLEGADHTFSSTEYRGAVENWTLGWLDELVIGYPNLNSCAEKTS
jgi:exosortase A-associated hydrolase 1